MPPRSSIASATAARRHCRGVITGWRMPNQAPGSRLLGWSGSGSQTGPGGWSLEPRNPSTMDPILTRFVRESQAFTLDSYLKQQGGYEGLRKALEMTPDGVIDVVKR